MPKETLYLCDKKKDCNKSLSCIYGICMYTTDPNHCANKGIKEKIANAKPSSSLFRELTENMTEEEIQETVIQAKVEARLYEWLMSFNTDSATECFTAVQELKRRLEDKNE